MRSLIAIFVAGVLISTTVPSNAAPTPATRKLVTEVVVWGLGLGVAGSTGGAIMSQNGRSMWCSWYHINDNTTCPPLFWPRH